MSTDDSNEVAPTVLEGLLSNHLRFLEFLERRTGSRSDAEDVLQDAFIRVMEKGGGVRRGETAVAWFYRVLRNALVDRQRSSAARVRALDGRADATEAADEDDEVRAEVCRCIGALLPILKPEYSDLIERVDLRGQPVHAAATALGISANLAGVRLHRARKALLREVQKSCRTCAAHGCLDCSCASQAPPGSCGV